MFSWRHTAFYGNTLQAQCFDKLQEPTRAGEDGRCKGCIAGQHSRMQPDGPETSPPKMNLAWPPKTTNLTLASTAVRCVILAAEPQISLTPTMLLWCLAMASMKCDERLTPSDTLHITLGNSLRAAI